jgi:aspartyl/asparaginyl beta-hydroxylase (cupin superfamily)
MYIEEIVSSTWEHLGEVKTQQAMLAKLKAGTVIPRHMDKGPLTAKTHRIHVPVITNEGCIFNVGNESMNLKSGQIWVIDNVNRYHSVENTGHDDRVHLIIDAI